MGQGRANEKLLVGVGVRREGEEHTYLVDTRPYAAALCDCADGDDVDVKMGVAGVLCETSVDGAFEGLEICLRECDDIFWLVELDGGGDEDGEVALELGDEFAGRWIVCIGVVERGEVACDEAVDKGLELVGVKVVGCGGDEGEGEDKVAEDVLEEGEVDGGCVWGCKRGAEVSE